MSGPDKPDNGDAPGGAAPAKPPAAGAGRPEGVISRAAEKAASAFDTVEIVDFAELEKNLPASLAVPSPRQQPYVPRHAREKTRTWLAIATLILFGVEIVGPFILLITHTLTMAEIKELLGIQFAAVASLAGSTLGFYFGSKSAKGDDVDG